MSSRFTFVHIAVSTANAAVGSRVMTMTSTSSSASSLLRVRVFIREKPPLCSSFLPGRGILPFGCFDSIIAAPGTPVKIRDFTKIEPKFVFILRCAGGGVQTDSLHSASRASRKAPHPLLRFSSQNRNDVSVLKGRAAKRTRPRVLHGGDVRSRSLRSVSAASAKTAHLLPPSS